MCEIAREERTSDTLCFGWPTYRTCTVTWKLREWMEITVHLEVIAQAMRFVGTCAGECGRMEPLPQCVAFHHEACLVCAAGRIKWCQVSH